VLADDEQRANTLLALHGGPAKEQDKSLPDAFLLEIMQIREDMQAALAGADAGERQRIEHLASDRRAQYVAAVRAMFASLGQPPQPEHLAAIRRELNAWRYIERMLEQLRDA
jgi:molecular chaperone HscB